MQPGFFDRDERLARLEKLGDPLPQIEKLVNWAGFRAVLEKAWPVRSPSGGRPPYDAVLMFKVLVLQPRNTREENRQIKAGEVPEGWSDAKHRQKDTQARWAKKYGVSHFGYKNHISTDVGHKLIRRYQVTDAATGDTRMFDSLLDGQNRSRDVWADAAYRSRPRLARLRADGYRPHLQRQAQANAPLTARQRATNRRFARGRCQVEHVFGQQTMQEQRLVQTIGLARARVKIGLFNLAYNLRRWAFLTRQALRLPAVA